ncbi:macrolide family glycosyltransferase [Pseudonocardia xinjiangensis]|uniref:macrolide family glycosyltransferase n=1 Tax=Pseudonocardia xinjiangensis TaxID=75289 RepID=UPI003D8D134A
MSHILVVTVSAMGHIQPIRGILRELVTRGHRVSCPVSEEFAALIASTGATPVAYEQVTTAMPATEGGSVDLATFVFGMNLAYAQRMLPQLEEMFDDDRPDIVVYEATAYAGYALALRWGLSAVVLSACRVSTVDDQRPTEWLPVMAQTPKAVETRARFAGWLAGQGIPLSVVDFLRRPSRCLVLIPRMLQPEPERFDPTVYTFVGPCIDGRPEPEPWPAPDRPLVLVSLGTAFTDSLDFFRTCITAFSGQGWLVVLSVGVRHIDPDDLGPLPPDIEVHRRVPQLSVLRHASLFVTHAGAGSSSEAVALGVPMIAVPQAIDQFDNAAMLAEAGVATVLGPGEATPDALRRAAHEVMASEKVAAACRDAAESVPRGGAATAVDAIESMIAGAPGNGR